MKYSVPIFVKHYKSFKTEKDVTENKKMFIGKPPVTVLVPNANNSTHNCKRNNLISGINKK